MGDVIPFQKELSCLDAEEIIRKWTARGLISLSGHCKGRMRERGITIQQIMICLAKGKVTAEPFFTHENGGGHETTVERLVAGDRLRIGVCLKLHGSILIITAIKL